MCLHYIWVEVPATCAHSSNGSCKVHARLQQELLHTDTPCTPLRNIGSESIKSLSAMSTTTHHGTSTFSTPSGTHVIVIQNPFALTVLALPCETSDPNPSSRFWIRQCQRRLTAAHQRFDAIKYACYRDTEPFLADAPCTPLRNIGSNPSSRFCTQ